MAQFNFADLGCDEKGDSIEFKINYEINFRKFEKEIPWELTLKIFEFDRWTKNDLKRVIHKTIDPKDYEKRIVESIKKEDLNTEWGDDEYFVEFEIKPLQLPSRDSISTNFVKLNL